jgi:GntR family transcriptional regulator, transcriptional repressor for pyruvate dehydrogenase complex
MPASAQVSRRRQLRLPRVAEIIAATLRDRIVNGEIEDGALLPKQDDLLEEFRVSRPSIREALRILETEGLVTVRRGSVGGAVAHAPNAHDAAYMFALALQSRDTSFQDLAQALSYVEPACAALCAARKDRKSGVVKVLRSNIDERRKLIGDGPEFSRLSRAFHDDLVSQCGNKTMMLVFGTLQALLSSLDEKWSGGVPVGDSLPEPTSSRALLSADKRLVDAIESGSPDLAEKVARKQLEETQRYLLAHGGKDRIAAGELRLRS